MRLYKKFENIYILRLFDEIYIDEFKNGITHFVENIPRE